MPRPDTVYEVIGDPVVFADWAGDFGPAAANDLRHGTPTQVQLSLASLAHNAWRQSSKADLGANRAPLWRATGVFEWSGNTSGGFPLELWWAPSPSATAGTGNPGNTTGSDSAWTGYSSNPYTAVFQLQLIGTRHAPGAIGGGAGGVTVVDFGLLLPTFRYGNLIVLNDSGTDFTSDDVEMAVYLDPVIPRIKE